MDNDMPDMPPLGYTMHDLLLRMIAARSSRPDGPNVLLERFMQETGIERPVAPLTSQAPSPVQALSPPQNASSLGLLHQKLVVFFLDGAEEASIKCTALRQVALDRKVGKVTVLAVSLVEGDSGKKLTGYSYSAHTFVLGIAREGWRVFQAWGKHEYTLDEYFDCGGARLRDWKEAKTFIKAFGMLASAKAINDKYQECFEVDVLRICGKNGSRRPIVPVYRPWVRMFEFEDVKFVDIEKFAWR